MASIANFAVERGCQSAIYPLLRFREPIVLHRGAFLGKRQKPWAWLLQSAIPAPCLVNAAGTLPRINSGRYPPLGALRHGDGSVPLARSGLAPSRSAVAGSG